MKTIKFFNIIFLSILITLISSSSIFANEFNFKDKNKQLYQESLSDNISLYGKRPPEKNQAIDLSKTNYRGYIDYFDSSIYSNSAFTGVNSLNAYIGLLDIDYMRNRVGSQVSIILYEIDGWRHYEVARATTYDDRSLTLYARGLNPNSIYYIKVQKTEDGIYLHDIHLSVEES